jgi:mono/diheme cytochrome c family protein
VNALARGIAALGFLPVMVATWDLKNRTVPQPVRHYRPAFRRSIPDSLRSGRAIFVAECSACHGSRGDGTGPAARGLLRRPADLTTGRRKLKSAGSPLHEILTILERGIQRAGMPSYRFLPKSEQQAVARYVLTLGPNSTNHTIKTPVPPARVDLAEGRAALGAAHCTRCHQGRWEGEDTRGQKITAPDLVTGEFLGGESVTELFTRISYGLEGTPMPEFHETLSERTRWSISYYLHETRKARRAMDPPRPMDARWILTRYRCQACHVIEKKGGHVGPSLDKATRRLTESWIRRWLTNPREPGKVYPDRPYRMPNLGLSRKEVEIMVSYLRALGGRSTDVILCPIPDRNTAREGEVLYRKSCNQCHSLGTKIPAIQQPTGPDLLRVTERIEYDWLLQTILTEGLKRADADKVRQFVWKVASDQRR